MRNIPVKWLLNLDQWFRGLCRLKIFPIYSSGGHFVQQSGTTFCRPCFGSKLARIISQWENLLMSPLASRINTFTVIDHQSSFLCHLLLKFESLYSKECGPRSDCSIKRSSLIWVHTISMQVKICHSLSVVDTNKNDLNLLLHNNTFWRLWNIMYLKILWKMEHLLQKSKCSIFHNTFKSIHKSIAGMQHTPPLDIFKQRKSFWN